VDPAAAPNDLDTPILIGGAGFSATPMVYLGDTALTECDLGGFRHPQRRTVPWGMAPGAYPLTVVNPDEVSATLPAAFTVTAGLGEFVSGWALWRPVHRAGAGTGQPFNGLCGHVWGRVVYQ
jgi:hypothetical protein